MIPNRQHKYVLVYVGTYTTNSEEGIYWCRMNLTTGQLELIGEKKPITNPFFLTSSRKNNFLYATISSVATNQGDPEPEGEIAAFSIEPTSGNLSLVSKQPSGGVFPCFLELDLSERFILVGNYNSGSVAVLSLDNGHLGEPTDVVQHTGSSVNKTRQDGPHVHSIVLDPQERFAYAADLGTDKEMIYSFKANEGKLIPAMQPWVKTVAGAGPRHFAFHPNGSYAYLLNELNGTLTAFVHDSVTGTLHERQTVKTLPTSFDGENYAADIQIVSNGNFLYCTNRGHNSIAVFGIDSHTGELTNIAHEPACGKWPWNIEIDPTDRFLIAANYESDNVVVFEINHKNGRLRPTGHEISVPKPTCVTIGPNSIH